MQITNEGQPWMFLIIKKAPRGLGGARLIV